MSSSAGSSPKAFATCFVHRRSSPFSPCKIASVADPVEPSEQLLNLSYDGMGRLRSGTLGGVAFENGYDGLGNLTLKTGTAQLYQHPDKPHAIYDASGNLTRHGERELGYDARGRLRTAAWRGFRQRNTGAVHTAAKDLRNSKTHPGNCLGSGGGPAG